MKKNGRRPPLIKKYERKLKLSERDSRALLGVFKKDYKTIAPKITLELNNHFNKSCSLNASQKLDCINGLSL